MSTLPFLESVIPLYFIYLSNCLLKGRTRLQKLVFLFQMKSGINVDYQFEKGYYGPVSYKLYSIADNLVRMGLLSKEKHRTPSGNVVIYYELTSSGKSLANFASERKILSEKIHKIMEKIYQEYGTLPLIELINKVYEEFPEWAEKSVLLSP